MIAQQRIKEVTPDNIEEYLEQHQQKELLRFVAVGSVDDGKSTLIGRLLHDTHGIYEDQLKAVKQASKQNDGELDLSLVTDGLKAEREQGITIDVAYRYFSTARRKFIIADTPGHIQYTRNMATGASTASVAIILIDARLGVLQQSRRHAHIASMLGIPHLAVAVNKMDLKDYDQEVFDAIVKDFKAFADHLNFKDVTFTPISALRGDNCVHKSNKTPWFKGQTMLEYLETVPIFEDRNYTDFRFPVQYVQRPNLNYRGFSGEIASGIVQKGDRVLALPSGKESRVQSIDVFEGSIDAANAPMSVTLRLEDEIDISRGDMLVHPQNRPHVGQSFEANLVWMTERSLDRDKSYLLKQTTQTTRVQFDDVESTLNFETLAHDEAETLNLNDIGKVRLTCHRPICFDPYSKNRRTGAFIIIDSLTNNTVAAGMITGVAAPKGSDQGEEEHSLSQVSRRERQELLGQRGAVVWITGEAGSRRELLYTVERRLTDLSRATVTFDCVNDSVAGGLGASQASAAAQACASSQLIALVATADALPEAITAPGLSVHYGTGTNDDTHLYLESGASPEQSANQIVDWLTNHEIF